MTVNVELLEQVMLKIENDPEKHNQSNWRCGTSFCFAGHACIEAGATLWKPEETLPRWKAAGIYSSLEEFLRFKAPYAGEDDVVGWATEEIANINDAVIPPGLTVDERRAIAVYAAEVLGLDEYTEDVLFGASNSRQDLRRMVDHIKKHGTLDAGNWEDGDWCDCEGCTGA